MAIIDKIYLKNAEGENVEYDIGASAQNIQFNSTDSVKDKIDDIDTTMDGLDNSIDNLSSSVSNHTAASVVGTNGIHDIRYQDDKIQVFKNGSQVNASSQLSAEKGISISAENKIGHSNNVIAGTIGSSGNTNGASFDIPYANYDTQGHITSKGNRTHTVPTASTSTAGVVKVDGSTVTISNGVISASGSTISAGTGLSKSGSTINHSNSITAGTIGSSSATSGTSISIPYANYDAQGHITGRGNRTHTIPIATNSNIGLVKPDNKTVFIKPDGTLTTDIFEGGSSQMTGSDTAIKQVIDKYYQKEYSLEDIKSIQSVGDIRQANSTDCSSFKVASHSIKAANPQWEEPGTISEMTTIKWVIIDFDHTVLKTPVNNINNALITIQMYGVISESAHSIFQEDSNAQGLSMNLTDTNVGGQQQCAMRSYLNNAFYNACGFKDWIKMVKNPTVLSDDTTTVTQCEDKIFLLSENEVNNNSILPEGTLYNYFTTSANRRKKEGQEGIGADVSQSLRTRAADYNDEQQGYMGPSGNSTYMTGEVAVVSPACAL